MKSFPLLLANLSVATAFQAARQTTLWPSPRSVASPPLHTELSPVDEMCIENVAEFCLHESCDIEEYEALINQLEEQKQHFIEHVANVEELLSRLRDSNHPEHDPVEVDALINNIKDTLANPPARLNGGSP